MLTKKQYELLIFIDNHLKTRGVSPSFDEMKDALGLKSKSGVHRLITGLEERGFLKRLPHRARALKIIKLPENVARNGTSDPRFSPSVIDGGRKITGDMAPAIGETVQIPLYGRIAAGLPIEALADESEQLELPTSLLGHGNHYALEVQGDSMIDAGILDGDIAIIEQCDTAENGAIIVAFIDQSEVTLKRLRKRGESIALEPANAAYETRIFGPDRVTIQGRLKVIFRQY